MSRIAQCSFAAVWRPQDRRCNRLHNLGSGRSGAKYFWGGGIKHRGVVILVTVVLVAGAAIVIHALHDRGSSQEYSGAIETREI